MTPNLLDELEKIVPSAWRIDFKDGCRVTLFEKPASPMYDAVGATITPLYDAPALADMAKRLEAAERAAGKCWALHFRGPDDVVAVPSREAAEIAARNFNAFWDAHKHQRDHDVRAVAEVIEWEHGAVEHAKSAAQHWPEYAALLTAAIDATQEGEAPAVQGRPDQDALSAPQQPERAVPIRAPEG